MGTALRLGAAAGLLMLAGCVGVAAVPQQSIADGTPLGATCYAGVYVCPVVVAAPAGSPCSCPGLGAPSYGYVR